MPTPAAAPPPIGAPVAPSVADPVDDPLARVAGSRLIYGFIPKIKELADRSKDKIRADLMAKLTKLMPDKIRRMFFQEFVVQ